MATQSTLPRSTKSARARQTRFLDIAALRPRLPAYWWNEVSRVRALIEDDAETGSQAAEHFEYVAEALQQAGEEALTHEHAVALAAASRQLSAIAAQQALPSA